MTHLSAFDGPLGYMTLHPLFSLAPVLIASLLIALAVLRRRSSPHATPDRR